MPKVKQQLEGEESGCRETRSVARDFLVIKKELAERRDYPMQAKPALGGGSFCVYENRKDRCYGTFPILLSPERKHPERRKCADKGMSTAQL